jgi:NAD+ diphosphatase
VSDAAIIPGFTGAAIDRADAIRNDRDRLVEARTALSARLLRLDGLDPEDDGTGNLVWGSLAEVPEGAELAFLGLVDNKPRWVALAPPGARVDARSRTVWRVLSTLAPDQMALYAAARSLVDWHARHRFCANCGAPTDIAKGGWQRDCSVCGAQHFPRTDPVVIMLAEQGDAVLVGRQPAWPSGNFSALAGFVEPGESIEEAVARELFEEAGVRATSVRYTASQPWPFPSSLMIACIATVEDRAITLDTTELEAAKWVTADDVRAALDGSPDASFTAPPPFAIANSLFRHWLAGL